MKKILMILATFGSVSAFGATDAQIVGAVFNNEEFLATMGASKLDDIQIVETGSNQYQLTVNSKALMVDGCSISALVSEDSVRYPIDPATTGIRTILDVTAVIQTCPHR